MSARSLRLKAQLASGRVVIGSWLTVPDAAVAEIMADAGFDYVLIDTEHAPWSLESLQVAMLAFRGVETVPIVRVPWNDHVSIKQALDLGAEGIMAPMVRTLAEAKTLLAACRYPPQGSRGFGPRRASAYGRNTDAYVAEANCGVIVIPQLEDVHTVDEIDSILALDGIDALCIGPNDLSGSIGAMRQHDHPVVVNAIDRTLAAARARNVAVCAGVTLPAEGQRAWIERGARMILVTSDIELLARGATGTLEAARAAFPD